MAGGDHNGGAIDESRLEGHGRVGPWQRHDQDRVSRPLPRALAGKPPDGVV